MAPRPARRPRLLKAEPGTTCSNQQESLEPQARDYLAFVLGGAGVDLSYYRVSPLLRRLSCCLRTLKCRSIMEATSRLEQEPKQIETALGIILIGVTEFFRDPHVFTYLDEVVLPKLATGRERLCVWSAGCAGGAELYSVAMLLARRGLLEGSTLVGTDCREDAVDRARRGWFDDSQVAGLPPSFRKTFFVPEGRGWRVCDALRRATRWKRGDVFTTGSVVAPAWDLVLCRNVAIYLKPDAATLLWMRLRQAMRVGGVLVTGKAERPDGGQSLARLAPCVFQRRV